MKIHCDNCDRELGTYLYGKGGVEERAVISNSTCKVNHYNRSGELDGFRILKRIFPDVVCFECLKKQPKIKLYEKSKKQKQN